jgi:16S rRNA (guanine966-N2)-methyltransferase
MKPRRLRIIGGDWRGRKIDIPAANSQLRPTPDAVRETLFNWLQEHIQGARCLDLFAGSGALGIEALSRGAQSVDFVEADQGTSRMLQSNLERLGTQQSIYTMDARRFVRQIGGEWDVVFLDPPFRYGMLNEMIQLLFKHECLAGNARLYLESEKNLPTVTLPEGWAMLRQKQSGQVAYCLIGPDTK